MSDQADTLREMMRNRQAVNQALSKEGGNRLASGRCPLRVITVSSGKGGVGKSCLVANLGAQLARSGLRVLLVDGDMGLANLDILLGVQPGATFEQVLDGDATIQQAVLGVEPGLWLLPAASGLMELRKAGPETRGKFLSVLQRFPWDMDIVLVDLGAGIQDNVLSLHHPSYESVILLTPEPTSLTDAYGLIKLLRKKVGISEVGVIVNQVADGREAQQTFNRLRGVASRFVDTRIDYLGHWQRDEKVTQSVMNRKILLDLDPGAPSIPSLELLSKRFLLKTFEKRGETPNSRAFRAGFTKTRFKDEPAQGAPGNTAGFWNTLLGEVNA